MKGIRRFYFMLLAAVCLSTWVPCAAFAEPADLAVRVILDGRELTFSDQPAVIVDDRTLVPFRDIFEAMDAIVFWDEGTSAVTAVRGTDICELTIGDHTAYRNNRAVALDVAPQLIAGRTMVPLRFIGESFGAEVGFDGETSTVTIKSRQQTQEPERPGNDELFARLPAGKEIVSNTQFASAGLSGAEYARRYQVSVSDMPFHTAMRYETTVEPELSYSTQTVMHVQEPIEAGDLFLVTFWARGIASDSADGRAVLEVVHEDNVEYNKILNQEVYLEPDGVWRRYYLSYEADRDIRADGSQINLRVGYEPQIFEIAEVVAYDYSDLDVTMDDLPTLTATYAGREADAPWRAQAWERIEAYRKADFEIAVVGEGAAPISGADISVRMVRNAFDFGTAVNRSGALGNDDNSRLTLKNLKRFFNSAVPESELKRPVFADEPEVSKASVNKLLSCGVDVRGHTMVWDRPDKLPDTFATYITADPKRMELETLEHIRKIGTMFSGYLDDWDVANEIMQNHYMRDVLGDETLVKWYQTARQADPHAVLYLNENTVGSAYDTQARRFAELVKRLQDMGAPIEGIGLQGHYANPFHPEQIVELADKLSPLVRELKITEYDFDTEDEALQADFTRDILLAVYSHPAFTGFYMWGMYDGQHWLKNSAMFREDWTLKPSGAAYIDMAYRQFWTDEKTQTGADGTAQVRGFTGEYIITVNYEGRQYQQRAELERSGDNRIVFDLTKEPQPLPEEQIRQVP